jgi:hypothetical protein
LEVVDVDIAEDLVVAIAALELELLKMEVMADWVLPVDNVEYDVVIVVSEFVVVKAKPLPAIVRTAR